MGERTRLLFLTGPTACGKSRVGLVLAERLGAEILSLDSMAIYRGMDIGTDKPSAEDRARVPHHLIDLCEPSESFSTGRYVAAAEQAIAGTVARGRVPLFVGGTALYLKALAEGLFEGPQADWPLRRRLRDEASRAGTQPLYERLRALDPAYAAKIHPNDLRRIVRALEVYEKTGRPISELHTQFGRPSLRYDCRVVCMRRAREEITRRIDRRVEMVFERGLVEEVRLLIGRGGLSQPARQALGYRQALAHLEGRLTIGAAVTLTQRDTRRFAKRQMTWFRSMPYVQWLDAAPDEPAEALAERAAALLR
jgi:tRNA dimethylallyltransferase